MMVATSSSSITSRIIGVVISCEKLFEKWSIKATMLNVDLFITIVCKLWELLQL